MIMIISRSLNSTLWSLAVRLLPVLLLLAVTVAQHLTLVLWRLTLRVLPVLTRYALRRGPPLFCSILREGRAAVAAYVNQPQPAPSAATTATVGLSGARYCGQCGERAASGVEFCQSCGLLLPGAPVGLTPAVLRPCPACDGLSDPTNYFCTECGAPWSAQARRLQPRPAAVEVAATLHTFAGFGVLVLTLPFSLVSLLALAGHPLLAGWLSSPGLPIGIVFGVWGVTWLGCSLALARGLRLAQSWARTATIMVALTWSLTGIGALVAIPLTLGLLLPSANAYFGGRRPAYGRRFHADPVASQGRPV